MSITIAEASVEERIKRYVESGRFSDATDVVAVALDALAVQDQDDELRALIRVGLDQIERGESVPWTPQLMDEVWTEALAASRHGDSIPDHVKP